MAFPILKLCAVRVSYLQNWAPSPKHIANMSAIRGSSGVSGREKAGTKAVSWLGGK